MSLCQGDNASWRRNACVFITLRGSQYQGLIVCFFLDICYFLLSFHLYIPFCSSVFLYLPLGSRLSCTVWSNNPGIRLRLAKASVKILCNPAKIRTGNTRIQILNNAGTVTLSVPYSTAAFFDNILMWQVVGRVWCIAKRTRTQDFSSRPETML